MCKKMSKNEITDASQQIARALDDLPPIYRLIVFVTLVPDKNQKAMLVQDYIQKHGPIPDEYADNIRKALGGAAMTHFGLYDDYVEERTDHKDIKIGDLVQILPTASYIDPDLDTYDVVSIQDGVAELLGTHTGKRLLGPLRGLVVILRKENRE